MEYLITTLLPTPLPLVGLPPTNTGTTSTNARRIANHPSFVDQALPPQPTRSLRHCSRSDRIEHIRLSLRAGNGMRTLLVKLEGKDDEGAVRVDKPFPFRLRHYLPAVLSSKTGPRPRTIVDLRTVRRFSARFVGASRDWRVGQRTGKVRGPRTTGSMLRCDAVVGSGGARIRVGGRAHHGRRTSLKEDDK